MSAGTGTGVVDAMRFDIKRMHETWMAVIYPRQRRSEGTVLGKWTPRGGLSLVFYRLWSILGAPVVAVVYPFVLLGYFFRFQTRRLNTTALTIGFAGVVGLFVLLWGALAVLAKFQFANALEAGGVTAVVAASGVAVLSAALAFVTYRAGGRTTTVVLGYPFAMTAIFLPPVVAALFSTTLAAIILPGSTDIAQWLLDNALAPIGLAEFFSETFELEGVGYVIMWLAISFPIGWVLGLLVTLADIVRPTE